MLIKAAPYQQFVGALVTIAGNRDKFGIFAHRSALQYVNIDADPSAIVPKLKVQMSHVRLNSQKLRVVWHGYAVHLAEICRRPIEIPRYAIVAVVF